MELPYNGMSNILQEYLDKKYSKIKQYNLKELDCSDLNLTSLKGIENLTNLEFLFCFSNKLTSLNGIENLKKLKYISCRDNKLTTLKGIENLINLNTLYCYNNKLTSIKEIINLNNLNQLAANNNPLSKDEYELIDNLKKLKSYLISKSRKQKIQKLLFEITEDCI